MSNNELLITINLIKQLELQKSDIDAQLEALKDSIKAEMTAQDTSSLRVGNFKVIWDAYTSHRFDTSTFKVEHSDLYKQYSKPVQVKRFSIR